jgi:hypothetical protein
MSNSVPAINKKKNSLILSCFTNEDGMACSDHVDDRLSAFRDLDS